MKHKKKFYNRKKKKKTSFINSPKTSSQKKTMWRRTQKLINNNIIRGNAATSKNNLSCCFVDKTSTTTATTSSSSDSYGSYRSLSSFFIGYHREGAKTFERTTVTQGKVDNNKWTTTTQKQKSTNNISTSTPSKMGYISHQRTAITKRLWNDRLEQMNVEHPHAPEQTLIKTKKIKEHVVLYDFENDKQLARDYATPWNTARIGRVLEDMDSLAGNVVFTHIDDNDPATRPPNAVTASADNIRQFMKLRLDQKTFLHGSVAYVGTSSIVVRCDLKNEKGEVLMRADFTFAARSNATGKATPVNQLDMKTLTEEQKATFDEVKAQIELKKNRKMDKMPMREEVRVFRKQWVKKMREMSRVAKEMPSRAVLDEKLSKIVLTSQTVHENLFVAQPQQVNLSGRIFGGFLLRRGFELALANAYTFAGTFPLFVNMSDVDFRAPVEVGDLLRFRAHIIHVGEPGEFDKKTLELKETNVFESGNDIERDIVMQVEAIVVNPKTVSATVTNSFLITFRVNGGLLPTVLPESTDEAFGVFEKVIRPKLCGWD